MVENEQKIVGLIISTNKGVQRLVQTKDNQFAYQPLVIRRSDEPKDIVNNRPSANTSRKYTGGRG